MKEIKNGDKIVEENKHTIIACTVKEEEQQQYISLIILIQDD